MKFTESQLEQAFIELLYQEEILHVSGMTVERETFEEVLIKEDLREFLGKRYEAEDITANEIENIIRQLENYPSSDVYGSNKTIMKMISDGFVIKRENRNQKDLFIQLIDFQNTENNLYKFVNQLEIYGYEKRIPDGIIYINGLPLVVLEFKSAIREEATLHDAYVQLTTRYKRDIPELFKYNAFCIISDGVNNKAGSFFAAYEFFYAWRRVQTQASEASAPKSPKGDFLEDLKSSPCSCSPLRGLGGFVAKTYPLRNLKSPKVINSANPKLYKKLYEKSLEMRKNPTKAEVMLWEELRSKKMGVKFRQQHIIDQFIVDFYCVEKGLVIEIDGKIHNSQKDRDRERENILRSLGCEILRFTNEEVFESLDKVLERIRKSLQQEKPPTPKGEQATEKEDLQSLVKSPETSAPKSPKGDFAFCSPLGVGGLEANGINSFFSLVKGMLNKSTLCDIIHNFIYLPDTSNKEEKIVCRYPQYYAARKLFENIKKHQTPEGDGKGGTYFGATGCGKSFTMLFLTRLLMRSTDFESPTIVLITDRTGLDDQLSGQFTNAKGYIGDETVESVTSRADLRTKLQGRKSGGVFLTTIHKFNEDTELLTERNNVICISDEAHRSQINLDQKIRVTENGVKKSYGFAKHLHDSLPNATYVGFTGTPIDATLDVFGKIVDSYTMTESVQDEITVKIVYEGRATKVLLDNSKLREIEKYYAKCAEDGANENQIEESKRATTQMNTILGDPDRIKAVAEDFVTHYENRIEEASTIKGKAMFVCSNRQIAYDFYQQVISLKPEWAEIKVAEEGSILSEKEKKEIKPMERIKIVMTRSKDDPKELYDMLGTRDDRKELDRQFKNEKSNFKIAIVVDMWLTGFDVPFLDTIYIDKPIKRHSLIQTISRVNRKFEGKNKGLVVDYIGIKKAMNLALAHYNKIDSQNFEDIETSIIVTRDQLDILAKMFHGFDTTPYFSGSALNQLNCLNNAAEFIQVTSEQEKRFMGIVKRLKAAYDICSGSGTFSQVERDTIHFYLAVRSILYKLTKGDAPDASQMNAKVRQMISDAIISEGVEEIFRLGNEEESTIDIFDEDYLAKIDKIKLPNTKIKLLQQLLAKAISDYKKINKIKGTDFAKKMQALVEKYNERKESDTLQSEVLEEFTDEIIDLYHALKKEKESFGEMGIDFEEKAFYDILKALTQKYDFEYPDDKLLHLAKEVKVVVDDKAKYTDWSRQENIKAELKADLIVLLAENDYPPVDRDEVYKEIFEQAENFKRNQGYGLV